MAKRVASLLWFIIGGALAWLLASCASQGGVNVERPGVTVEAWRGLNTAPTAPWPGPRTAVYTYVLVGAVGGREFSGFNAQIQRARRSLFELLKEVQSLQSASGIRDAELLRRANLFCIPTAGKSYEQVNEKNFSFDLASLYLNQFRLLLIEQGEISEHLNGTGPFLIAVREPVNEIVTRIRTGRLQADRNPPVMLIDLSGAHPRSIPMYVNAFKDSVRREDVVESKVLTPLHPAFVSILLKINEAIPFVGEAYASMKGVAEHEPDGKDGAPRNP